MCSLQELLLPVHCDVDRTAAGRAFHDGLGQLALDLLLHLVSLGEHLSHLERVDHGCFPS